MQWKLFTFEATFVHNLISPASWSAVFDLSFFCIKHFFTCNFFLLLIYKLQQNMAIHVVEFRPTCRRGCACPVSALMVPLPCLSVPLVSVPIILITLIYPSHCDVPYVCCYSGLVGWKQHNAKPPNPLGYLSLSGHVSPIFAFSAFHYFVSTCSTAFIPEWIILYFFTLLTTGFK